IQEALEYFSPGPPPVAPAPSPPQSPSLGPQSSETFVESARAAAQRIAGLPVAESPIASLTAERQRIASGVEQAISRTRSLIAEGRAADAFARATLAERALLAWNAQAQAVSAATTGLDGTAAALAAQASEVRAAADTAIASNSSVPVTFLEQAAALPDALCWATDAWANASVAAAELEARTATTASALGELAGTLASARYDLDTYLPFSLAHARSIGLSEITDPTETNAILTGYAQLLADTGDTVLNDARRQGPSASTAPLVEDPQAWEFAVLQALGSRWDDQQRAAGSQDAVSASLTTAMSYYVAASTLAATSELTHSEGDRRVFSPADWTTQVDVATAESLRSAIRAETLGLDPDYLAWNEGFGRGAATAADTTGANDAFRLGGLQVQWYGNVQGHMLLTLAGARSATATTG
ncbi:MAG: hypothetical protein QG597_3229, partial [Actinomycetota bacterium]|nr:hypothetical protein [Actinomycetota bacterium]